MIDVEKPQEKFDWTNTNEEQKIDYLINDTTMKDLHEFFKAVDSAPDPGLDFTGYEDLIDTEIDWTNEVGKVMNQTKESALGNLDENLDKMIKSIGANYVSNYEPYLNDAWAYTDLNDAWTHTDQIPDQAYQAALNKCFLRQAELEQKLVNIEALKKDPVNRFKGFLDGINPDKCEF